VADLAAVFGIERRILIARELTKLFEESQVCALGEAQAWLAADAHRGKGEFVLVVEGVGAAGLASEAVDVEKTLKALLDELPLKQAVALAMKITGGSRNELYQQALLLKNETATD
jgi:16S rRNA (cytidine1402-2'-O)-methyltransferase